VTSGCADAPSVQALLHTAIFYHRRRDVSGVPAALLPRWTPKYACVRGLMKSWVTGMCGCYTPKCGTKANYIKHIHSSCNEARNSYTVAAWAACLCPKTARGVQACSDDQQRYQTVQCSRPSPSETHSCLHTPQQRPAAVQPWAAEQQHGRNFFSKGD
jgi:hypothetical protein